METTSVKIIWGTIVCWRPVVLCCIIVHTWWNLQIGVTIDIVPCLLSTTSQRWKSVNRQIYHSNHKTTYKFQAQLLVTSVSQKITAKMWCIIYPRSLLLTKTRLSVVHFFLDNCDVCPLAIPKYFANSVLRCGANATNEGRREKNISYLSSQPSLFSCPIFRSAKYLERVFLPWNHTEIFDRILTTKGEPMKQKSAQRAYWEDNL